MRLSKSQIQKLGERLRRVDAPLQDSDLTLLDEYCQTFEEPYGEVMRVLADLGLNPTGRLPKTTRSITAKLTRLRTNLARMQDIAGCRVVVATCADQDQAAKRLCGRFPGAEPDDLRVRPSNGYRAVHVVVEVAGRPVEVQIRTHLQQLWAEVSEKLADRFGLPVKYGQGPELVATFLAGYSDEVAEVESLEDTLASVSPDYPGYGDLQGRLSTVKDALEGRLSLILDALDGLDGTQ